MLYVLMEAHEAHYTAELKGVSPRQMVVQPVNRGTLPAAVFSLLRLTQLDPLAIVAFVPSDHFYEDEAGFRTGLDLAYEIAEDNGGAIVLLGAKASSADVEYGWIEPTKITAIGLGRPRLYRVRNFWEKPSTDVAQSLLEQGCLWNTFTMVGRASTFLRMIEAAAPRVYHAFSRVTHEDRAAIRTVYNALSASDFSRDVLTTSTHMLSVLSLGDLGWSDLGSPGRALDALTRSGLQIVPA
jgi:mannose-1-phosphate guanylyltransferase